MKRIKAYMYATLLAAPIIGMLFYLLNPAQCPLDYIQEQIYISRCVIGVNIGGMPVFIIAAITTWVAAVWLLNKVSSTSKASGKHS